MYFNTSPSAPRQGYYAVIMSEKSIDHIFHDVLGTARCILLCKASDRGQTHRAFLALLKAKMFLSFD